MKLVKGIACGICALAFASAAWANESMSSDAFSMQADTAPVIPGTESTEAEFVIVETPQQFVVVEEWYIFPSSEDLSLGG